MRIVVTGGAGFIGANLCRLLDSRPEFEHVVALDNLSTGFESNLNGQSTELVVGDILDTRILTDVLGGADAVVHLAARPSVPRSLQDPQASHLVNATGTLQVLDAARRANNPLVIVASSSSVYGANPALPKHEGLTAMPMSPYAVSKLAAESYSLAYQHCFGVPVLPFRFFNVFGPLQSAAHDYAAVIPSFISAALRNQPVTIFGDGHQTRDFTFVDSVAEIICRGLLERVRSETPVNLAFGSRVSLQAVLRALEETLGRSIGVVYEPSRPGDVRDSQADGSLLSNLFPEVQPVSLAVGLAETVRWFRSIMN